jgi:hypothetical protein
MLVAIQAAAAILGSGAMGACLSPCGSLRATRALRAVVLDSATLRGLTEAAVTVVTITEGVETGAGSTITARGETPPAPDGSLQLTLYSSDLGGNCGNPPKVPFFPPPDQVEVTVVRGACEEQFLIDINADTIVDLKFPDDVIELKDPILVPPCEP